MAIIKQNLPASFDDFLKRLDAYYNWLGETDDEFIPCYSDFYLKVGVTSYDLYVIKNRTDGRVVGKYSWCEGHFSDVADLCDEAKEFTLNVAQSRILRLNPRAMAGKQQIYGFMLSAMIKSQDKRKPLDNISQTFQIPKISIDYSRQDDVIEIKELKDGKLSN